MEPAELPHVTELQRRRAAGGLLPFPWLDRTLLEHEKETRVRVEGVHPKVRPARSNKDLAGHSQMDGHEGFAAQPEDNELADAAHLLDTPAGKLRLQRFDRAVKEHRRLCPLDGHEPEPRD